MILALTAGNPECLTGMRLSKDYAPTKSQTTALVFAPTLWSALGKSATRGDSIGTCGQVLRH